MEEIVNRLNNEAYAKSDSTNNKNKKIATTITPPTRKDLDDAMKTLSKLNLFTDDVDFDPMLSKLSEENTQNRLQTMQQFSIYNYFKQYIVTRTKAVA